MAYNLLILYFCIKLKKTVSSVRGLFQKYFYSSESDTSRDVNTRVLGYPGPVWPTRVPTWVP